MIEIHLKRFSLHQLAIIASNEVLAYFNNEAVLDQAPSKVVEKVRSYRETRRAMTPDQAFHSLCPKLKSIFSKRHFPMVKKKTTIRYTQHFLDLCFFFFPAAGDPGPAGESSAGLFHGLSQGRLCHRAILQLRSTHSSRCITIQRPLLAESGWSRWPPDSHPQHLPRIHPAFRLAVRIRRAQKAPLNLLTCFFIV